ncbi:hypothetical protein IFM89_026954 [Coptis chinensis]|uniref:Uncharacterized protein n=1 Tax=Coptis chinensis TaxID=261450 RepID=A0A835I3R8_9MAGN|nr:hypothetical protein IFM89_026954 [Coptis chinensis]
MRSALKKKDGVVEIETSPFPKTFNTFTSSSSSTAVSRQPSSDAKRLKRVRFEEPETLATLCSKPDTCLRNAPGIMDPNCKEPKTSEYKFFKKFREEAGRSFRSYQVNKKEYQLEKSEVFNHTKGTFLIEISLVMYNWDSIPMQLNPTHNDDLDYPYYAERIKMVQSNHEFGSPSHIEKVTPINTMVPLSPGVSMNSGPERQQKGIFSVKRQNLVRLAAKTASLDINEICTKGYDLVSILLERLVPEGNVVAEISDARFNIESQLRVSPEPDMHFDEVPKTLSRNAISDFDGKNFRNSLLEPWSSKSRECILQQEVDVDLGSLLTWHPNKIHLAYERRQSEDVGSEGALSVHPEGDSAFVLHPNEEFSFDRDRYAALDYTPMPSRLLCSTRKNFLFNCESPDTFFGVSSKSSFKELDGLCCPKELTSDNDRGAKFLDWDTNIMEYDQNFSSTCGWAPNFSPTWSTPSENNLQTRNCIFNATTPPFAQSIRQYSDFTRKDTCSGSYLIDPFGRQAPEDEEYQVQEPDHFPLALCHSPKYLCLEEQCRLGRTMEETSIFRSPLSKNRFMSMIFSEKYTPALGTLLQSSEQINESSQHESQEISCDYYGDDDRQLCLMDSLL